MSKRSIVSLLVFSLVGACVLEGGMWWLFAQYFHSFLAFVLFSMPAGIPIGALRIIVKRKLEKRAR